MMREGMSDVRFITSPQVQALSAQAECFFNRLIELIEFYPTILNEQGHAPADPAQLRNLCYPHKPDIRFAHVERWLAEIEHASLVTVYENGLGRWLMLSQRAPPPVRNTRKLQGPLPSSGDPMLGLSNAGGSKLIHISGDLSPPDPNEIAAVAAAATDSLDLIASFEPYFPRHNVGWEFERYRKNRKKADQPCTAVSKNPRELTFTKWMLNASVPIGKPGKIQSGNQETRKIAPPSIEPGQPDLFEESARAKALAGLAECRASLRR